MIPCTFFRSSSITEYTNCPLRYFANHCLGIKYPAGPAALSGTIFHKIMEILAQCKISQQEKLRLSQQWGLYYDVETQLSFSFPDISTIDVEKLTENVYEFYIKQIDPSRVPKTYQRKTPEASVRAWIPFKKVKESVDNVMSMSPRSFDPRLMDIVAVEQKFDVEIKEPWARYDFVFRGKRYSGQLRLKGSIDLIIRNDDGTMSIIDWKSGKSENMNTGEKKTYEDYAQDLQMAMYYMVTRRYLNMDVSDVTLCFLNERECYTLHFDEDMVLDKIKSIYEEMQTSTRPSKIDSDFCMRFCPYSKNDFSTITTKPLVKPREYTWTNEVGINENRVYRMCGQINNYFTSGYLPLQVMEAIARKDFDLEAYINT